MHTNGVMSRKRRSGHIDIRFFFIKDRVDAGDVEVTFCGTEDMVADFLSKPLQGEIFRKFRDAIMGIKRAWNEGVCWKNGAPPGWVSVLSHCDGIDLEG